VTKIVLQTDLDSCGACHICELACSLRQAGECSPALSRIRVLRGEMKETLLVCRQCEVLFCAAACPEGAIQRDADSGVVRVDGDRCNGCQRCREACPFQAISFDAAERRALICDQCGGAPECAAWCPRGALRVEPYSAESRSRQAADGERAFGLLQQIRPRLRPA
jgi:carbon-monoxide dehydrogenase iron sulfur subunit